MEMPREGHQDEAKMGTTSVAMVDPEKVNLLLPSTDTDKGYRGEAGRVTTPRGLVKL